jgi:arabinoxylan arabinofuranohydrolase
MPMRSTASLRNYLFTAGFVLITSTLCACGGTTTSTPKPELPEFFIGNHAAKSTSRDDFARYWQQITPESDGFWLSVEHTRNQYDWARLDALYAFAAQQKVPVKANALISPNGSPAWVNGLQAKNLAAEIQTWIKDYCARYPNTPMINVVQNAMPGHSNTQVFANALGKDWVIQTFKWAREYCPDAVLILDDYPLLTADTDKFIDWVTPIVASGFVDAIGVQAHNLEDENAQILAANLAKIAAVGLPLYISEWEIGEEDDALQLAIMQQQLPIFYQHPSVQGITFWGYIAQAQFVSGANLLNEDNTPRPAFEWLQNYVKAHPK